MGCGVRDPPNAKTIKKKKFISFVFEEFKSTTAAKKQVHW